MFERSFVRFFTFNVGEEMCLSLSHNSPHNPPDNKKVIRRLPDRGKEVCGDTSISRSVGEPQNIARESNDKVNHRTLHASPMTSGSES